jgi:hypothetical protein
MMLKKMQMSTDNVLKCIESKCDKEFNTINKLHEKNVMPLVGKLNTLAKKMRMNKITKEEANAQAKPIVQKIKAHMYEFANREESIKLNSCSVKNCGEEHKKNFKVLNSHFTKECKSTQKERDCKLKELSGKFASKTHKLTSDDIKEFTILERGLQALSAAPVAAAKAAAAKAKAKAPPATAKAPPATAKAPPATAKAPPAAAKATPAAAKAKAKAAAKKKSA